MIAATSHAARAIGSAAAGRERNGVSRQLQEAGNGDGARAVDSATGQRAETAEGQTRIVNGAESADAFEDHSIFNSNRVANSINLFIVGLHR